MNINKENPKMTVEDIIDALETVLGALYIQKTTDRYQEVLNAAENITGALRYDFGITPYPQTPCSLPTGDFDF